MKRIVTTLLIFATFFVAPLAFSATIIDTTPGNGTLGSFGEFNNGNDFSLLITLLLWHSPQRLLAIT